MTKPAGRLRRIPRPVLAGALVALAGLIVVALAVASTNNSATEQGKPPSTSRAIMTTTEAATTTPTTATVPATTVAPGEDRLSSASRLGYAGLGPMGLGMAFDDAVVAAHVTVQPDPTCDIALYGEPGSGVTSISVWGRLTLDTITVSQPGISTISGIQVGSTRDDVVRTYPRATANGPSLVLTGQTATSSSSRSPATTPWDR